VSPVDSQAVTQVGLLLRSLVCSRPFSSPFHLPSLKMESRKRLGSDTAIASSSRPAKRVATDPEQIPIQTDPFAYEDLSFINDFRREAIYRTLVAERRETQRLKERLKTCEAHFASHDDHIRLIDIWLKQLLEELAVTYGQYDPSREGMSPAL